MRSIHYSPKLVLLSTHFFQMEDLEIRKVGLSDLFVIEELAKIIWREHYMPIIGANQVEYMLANFQSVAVMQEQIDKGYNYFLMIYHQETVGYLSIRQEADAVFLSKIYLLKAHRGKGIARTAMDFVVSETKKAGLGLIRLTVNKNNTGSILAYEKMGFQNRGSVVTEIGAGYVMDDFVMEKEIPDLRLIWCQHFSFFIAKMPYFNILSSILSIDFVILYFDR